EDPQSSEPTQCASWSNEDEYRAACENITAAFTDNAQPAAAQALGLLPSFAPLTAAQIATARAVYGSSIDYSQVYISDASGAGGRPFTVYIPLSGIQVINAGSLSPASSLLIHEMAHVWQSQHASDRKAFMTNSLGSQALAMANNVTEGSTDPQ